MLNSASVLTLLLLKTDEPGKPTGVEVVDWDKDHADLKWNKPENDGGAPITGYIIEYKVIYEQNNFRWCLFNLNLCDRKNSVKIG